MRHPTRSSTATARVAIAVVGLVLVTAFVLASELAHDDAWSRRWDNVHWTIAYLTGTTLALLGWSEASGSTRTSRGWFATGLGTMALGQIVWCAQDYYDWFPYPGPSDLPFALVGVCLYAGVAIQIRDLRVGERGAYALDAFGITLGVLAVTLALYIPRIGHFGPFAVVVLVSYAVLHIGAAGAALVLILARRIRIRAANAALVASVFCLGLCWVYWNWWMLDDALRPGVLLDYAFSYCTIAMGFSAARWDVSGEPSPELDRTYYLVSSSVPLLLVVTGALALVFGQRLDAVAYGAVRICFVAMVLVAAIRQSLLLRERDRTLSAERSMRDTEERFRQLVENIDDVFVIAPIGGGRPQYLGRAFESIWGRPVDEILDGTVSWTDTLHPDDRAEPPTWSEVAGVTSVVEYRIVRPDGETRTIRDRRTRIGPGGNERMVGILEDVTEARESSAKTAELQRLLAKSERLQSIGTLAGGIAHDFNNILAAVIANAEIASSSVANVGAPRTAIDGILAAGERAAKLVKSMLAFARYDEAAASPVGVDDLAHEVVSLLRPMVPSSIELSVTYEPSLPRVLIDATKLHQVLVNLITNANHAIGTRAGHISITVKDRLLGPDEVAGLGSGRFVEATVRDDGIGMDETTRARVFDPFFTTKRQGEGTGLGLSVVHGIVTSYRGGIQVESELGVGTAFRVLLPAYDAEEPARQSRPESTRPAPLPVFALTREVLLVDDDEMVNEATTLLLNSLGVRTHSEKSPEIALALLRASPKRFALVITDLTMPGMTGDAFAQAAKPIAPGVPFVLVSGNAVSVRPGLFVSVLEKPYSRATLADILARFAGAAESEGT